MNSHHPLPSVHRITACDLFDDLRAANTGHTGKIAYWDYAVNVISDRAWYHAACKNHAAGLHAQSFTRGIFTLDYISAILLISKCIMVLLQWTIGNRYYCSISLLAALIVKPEYIYIFFLITRFFYLYVLVISKCILYLLQWATSNKMSLIALTSSSTGKITQPYWPTVRTALRGSAKTCIYSVSDNLEHHWKLNLCVKFHVAFLADTRSASFTLCKNPSRVNRSVHFQYPLRFCVKSLSLIFTRSMGLKWSITWFFFSFSCMLSIEKLLAKNYETLQTSVS